MGIGKVQAFLTNAVNIRGGDAVTFVKKGDITVAQVIGHDDDDIGALVASFWALAAQKQEADS